MENAGKIVRQLREGGRSCVVLTPPLKAAVESAALLGQALGVDPMQLPKLAKMRPVGPNKERPAVAMVQEHMRQHAITVVMVPACDLPSMLHAFIGTTAGCRQKTGKVVWVDTDKRVHSVL
jgi:hypothetical protein